VIVKTAAMNSTVQNVHQNSSDVLQMVNVCHLGAIDVTAHVNVLIVPMNMTVNAHQMSSNVRLMVDVYHC
jgi:hypothetical protein